MNRIEIRGKVRDCANPLEAHIDVEGSDPVVTIADVLRTFVVMPDEGTAVRLTLEPATDTALVPQPPEPERGDLALRRISPSEQGTAMELRAALERCILIEGDETNGWTLWVHALGQPISLAGVTRQRRDQAAIDRRSLINGLVLALVPPRSDT